MFILRIILLAVVCSVITVLIKQVRPEITPFVQVSSVLVLLVVSLSSIRTLIYKLNVFSQTGDSFIAESAFTLFKVLVIAIGTKIASEICKDNGNSSLAVCVDLAGKIIMIILCFPLVETIFELSLSFVE